MTPNRAERRDHPHDEPRGNAVRGRRLAVRVGFLRYGDVALDGKAEGLGTMLMRGLERRELMHKLMAPYHDVADAAVEDDPLALRWGEAPWPATPTIGE